MIFNNTSITIISIVTNCEKLFRLHIRDLSYHDVIVTSILPQSEKLLKTE